MVPSDLPSATTSRTHGSTDDSETCLSCLLINRRKAMINCDGCHHWAHLSCVKLSKRQADAIPIWHCGPCSGRLLNYPGGSADSHSDVPDDMAEKLSFFKINCRLLKRLPKSSRLPVADSLTSRMEAALNHPTPHAWWYFMSFSYGILRTPT